MENLEYYNRNFIRQENAAVSIGGKQIFPKGGDGDASVEYSITKKTLFIGDFHTSHYGNFLFDYLARLWYVVNMKKDVALFAYTSNGFDLCDFPSYLHILSYFGITPENLFRITQPTAFECLIEPEPSFIHDKYYTLDYLSIYDHIKSRINTTKYPKYEKIYFTRRHLSRHKEVGEKIFEDFFQMNGYTVLAPESLSFEEQVSIVNNCSCIASIEGTLAHNIIFANRAGANVRQIILKKQSCIIPRQFMINQAIGIPAEYIEVYKEPFKGFPINYDRGPFLLYWNQNIRDFAAKEGMRIPNITHLTYLSDFIIYLHKCLLYLFKHLCKKIFRFLKQFSV